jgi:HEAT repeat protein
VRALVEGLKDKDGQVRRASAEGLGKLGARARGAVPALMARVADEVWKNGPFDPDPAAGGKEAALNALGKLAPERVEETLLKAVKSRNAAVRAWATAELARWNHKPAAEKAPEDAFKDAPKVALSPVVQALVDGLSDKDGKVRRDSADALRARKEKAAVPALVQRVADDVWKNGPFDPDPAAGGKTAALNALKELAPDRVQEALLKAIQSKNPAVKAWATTELGRAKEEK